MLSLIIPFLVVSCGGDGVTPAPDSPVDVDVDSDGDGVVASLDCNDADPAIHPGALELCNTVDDDCDGTIDENTATFDDGSGPVDISDVFAAGAADAPVAYTPPAAGTLTLCGGTYFTNLTSTADLELAGSGAETSIVDGGLAGRVLTAQTSGTTLTVHDVTLTHGMDATEGGAIACRDATLDVHDATISASTAADGGGVLVEQCTSTFTDVVIDGNQATNAGGLLNRNGQTTLTRVRVSANTATGSGGGLVNVRTGGQLAIIDSTITDNSSGGDLGGGIYTEVATTCTTSAITANTGNGVAVVGTSSSYVSTTCDYGTDAATDNTPADVKPANGTDNNFGDGASFNCSNIVCL